VPRAYLTSARGEAFPRSGEASSANKSELTLAGLRSVIFDGRHIDLEAMRNAREETVETVK